MVRLPITQSSAGRADGQGPLYAVLDGAHTEDSAAALAHSVRQAFPHAPIALVMSMAADKEHRAVVQALRELSPRVALFTAVPIAGSYQRAATPGVQARMLLGGRMPCNGRNSNGNMNFTARHPTLRKCVASCQVKQGCAECRGKRSMVWCVART